MSVRIINVRPGIETENYLRDTLNSLSLLGGIFLSFLVTWHRYKGPITRERQSNHCLNRQLYFVCDEQKYSTLLKHVTNRDQNVDVTFALVFSGGMLVLRLGAL